MKKYDWSNCKNILCIRPDNMGDVLMTQPAMRALKKSLPGRKITLLTSMMGAEIAQKLPEVDDIMVFDVPWIRTKAEDNDSEAIHELVSKLKTRNFDAAAVFTNYSQSALPTAMVCYLAEIPQVLAYSRENPYKLINNWMPDHEPFSFPVHGVQRQLDLVAATGACSPDKKLHLEVSKDTEEAALQKLKSEGLDPESPWLIMHPGVSEDKRKYPVELYGQAAKLLAAEGYQILITALECEKDLAKGVRRTAGDSTFNLAGKLSLDDFIALINLAPVIISNNTASVHVAAATGTPVVDLYARTNPEHTPWMVENRVFYFDVPRSIQSKNTTLVHTTPHNKMPSPGPRDIAVAVKELIEGVPLEKSDIPIEMMNWSNGKSNGTHTYLQQERRFSSNAYVPLLSEL
ncbi:MAG TPA: lipopolysaccharide heptosyltransferase II [Balneolaceae bacterium]|nr:lipopolysaccharide heptosyltransferase II [Balneolaceae bacterium]